MDIQEQHEISVKKWISEQENTISIIALNINYLTKEIELKQKALELYKESLKHEEKYLQDYLKQQ